MAPALTDASELTLLPAMPMAPLPLAMVICDALHRDPATGKFTILGTFSALGASEFPVALPQMAVYVALTDARGTITLTLRIVDANEESDPLAKADLDVEFPDPIAVMEAALVLKGVSFPKAGEYRLQLFASNEFVIERRLVVIPMKPDEEQSC